MSEENFLEATWMGKTSEWMVDENTTKRHVGKNTIWRFGLRGLEIANRHTTSRYTRPFTDP